MPIHYAAIMNHLAGLSYGELTSRLPEILEDLWVDEYRDMTPGDREIQAVPWDTFNYLFDCTSAHKSQAEFDWSSDVEERVVVVYGISCPTKEKRDPYYMRGVLGERERGDGLHYDRGHFIAHSIGGHESVGLFPQRRDINQARSPEGRLYTSMERYCRTHAGIFCFSRPLYIDRLVHPYRIEYGVLRLDGSLWIEEFPNRYTDEVFEGPQSGFRVASEAESTEPGA